MKKILPPPSIIPRLKQAEEWGSQLIFAPSRGGLLQSGQVAQLQSLLLGWEAEKGPQGAAPLSISPSPLAPRALAKLPS